MADRFQIDDPRFSGEREQPATQSVEWLSDEPPKKRSWVATCFIGCLITFVMLAAVITVGVYWVFNNWRDWASSMGSQAIKEFINATELPEQEKDEIGVEIDRMAEEVREGRMSIEELSLIFEDIMQSPLMTTIVASAIENKYISDSGLSDQEKTDGRQTLRRFLRGAVDNEISQGGIDNAMQHVAVEKEPGRWELLDKVSDEQLRAFFKAAKNEADAVDIPPEAENLDPSDEFKRIVDEAMQVH